MALDEHEALTVPCGQYDGRPTVQEAGARRSKNSDREDSATGQPA